MFSCFVCKKPCSEPFAVNMARTAAICSNACYVKAAKRSIAVELEHIGVQPKNIPSHPMCMSCGREVKHAVAIWFAHMCRFPEERGEHDQVLTACRQCLESALGVLTQGGG